MKARIIKVAILLIALSLAGCAGVAGTQVNPGFMDKQTAPGIREIAWSQPDVVETDPDLGMYRVPTVGFGVVIGPKLSNVSMTATLRVVGTSFKHMECDKVAWLADGQEVESLSQEYEHILGYYHVIETFKFAFAPAAFEKLAAAKSLSYRICRDNTFTVAPYEQYALRQVYGRYTDEPLVQPISQKDMRQAHRPPKAYVPA